MVRRKKLQPKINTSALPDIIFMLLFFFMVVTVLRDQQVRVKFSVPDADQVQKLKNQTLITNIYIGRALNPFIGSVPQIQINDAFIHKENLDQAVRQQTASDFRHQSGQAITVLKVDKEVPMGLVTDVKTALRKAQRLKISYIANAGE